MSSNKKEFISSLSSEEKVVVGVVGAEVAANSIDLTSTTATTKPKKQTLHTRLSLLFHFDLSYIMKLLWVSFSLFILIQILSVDVADTKRYKSKASRTNHPQNIEKQLDILQGLCFDSFHQPEWWSFIWCYKSVIKQIHINPNTGIFEAENDLGSRLSPSSTPYSHMYESDLKQCSTGTGNSILVKRRTKIQIKCCDSTTIKNYQHFANDMYNSKHKTFIEVVYEVSPCSYVFQVCSELVCHHSEYQSDNTQDYDDSDDEADSVDNIQFDSSSSSSGTRNNNNNIIPSTQQSLIEIPQISTTQSKKKSRRKSTRINRDKGSLYSYSSINSNQNQQQQQQVKTSIISLQTQEEARERVRKMFFHGYKSYIDHAFPMVS